VHLGDAVQDGVADLGGIVMLNFAQHLPDQLLFKALGYRPVKLQVGGVVQNGADLLNQIGSWCLFSSSSLFLHQNRLQIGPSKKRRQCNVAPACPPAMPSIRIAARYEYVLPNTNQNSMGIVLTSLMSG
jgi:hypothetical protein